MRSASSNGLVLDAEPPTDDVLFREMGLERLATTEEGRVAGVGRRSRVADLFSEVEANVP